MGRKIVSGIQTCGFSAVSPQMISKSKNLSDVAATKQSSGGRKATDVRCTTGSLVTNSQLIQVAENSAGLMVIGNNNRIKVARNTRRLDVIGDRNCVEIDAGAGDVHYVGTGGLLKLRAQVPEGCVHYVGADGVIISERDVQLHKEDRSTTTTSDNQTLLFGGGYHGHGGIIIYGSWEQCMCYLSCKEKLTTSIITGTHSHCDGNAKMHRFHKCRLYGDRIRGSAIRHYIPDAKTKTHN